MLPATPHRTAESRFVAPAPITEPDTESRPQTRPRMDEVNNLVQRLFFRPGEAPRTVVFSAVDRRSGCTWMAANAARVLANHTKRSVCLVDANLQFPALHTYFGVDNDSGFTDSTMPDSPLLKSARQLNPGNLWLITSGRGPQGMVLSADLVRSRLKQLQNEFDYAIVDAPALNVCNDAMILGAASDGIVLVLKANQSRREKARQSLAELKSANIRVLGAVLNQRTFPIPQTIYDRL